MSVLVPCERCERHVRAEESACPFCGAARVPQALAPPSFPMGLSRAALLLASATALVGCGKQPTSLPGPDETTQAPAYGAPPSYDDRSITPATVYGLAPVHDAGGAATAPVDAGKPAPRSDGAGGKR